MYVERLTWKEALQAIHLGLHVCRQGWVRGFSLGLVDGVIVQFDRHGCERGVWEGPYTGKDWRVYRDGRREIAPLWMGLTRDMIARSQQGMAA